MLIHDNLFEIKELRYFDWKKLVSAIKLKALYIAIDCSRHVISLMLLV